MIQVNYAFYKNEYAGTVIPDEESFKQPVLKANIYLNQVLRKEPSKEELNLVQLCLCELSDLIYQDAAVRNEHSGKDVQSENTDGYSITYASREENSLDVSVYDTIRRYLSNTGLLYLGVDYCADKCCNYNL